MCVKLFCIFFKSIRSRKCTTLLFFLILNKCIQVLLQCQILYSARTSRRAGLGHERQSKSGSGWEPCQLLAVFSLSIVSLGFWGAMGVEVAVHSVLRNHGVAESAFIRAAAAAVGSCSQLLPHVHRITQLGAPNRLQNKKIKDYFPSELSPFFQLTYAPTLQLKRSLKINPKGKPAVALSLKPIN